MMYTKITEKLRKEMWDNGQSWEDFDKCRTNYQMQEIKDMKEQIHTLECMNKSLNNRIEELMTMTLTQRFKMRIKFMLQYRVYKVINLLGSMRGKCYDILNKYLEV